MLISFAVIWRSIMGEVDGRDVGSQEYLLSWGILAQVCVLMEMRRKDTNNSGKSHKNPRNV